MRRPLHVVVIVLIAASVHAQTVTPHDDQTVTIRAEGVPIATLLAELARLYPLEKVTIASAVQQRPVWMVLERVPPSTALIGILKASGLDFALSGRRVIVGDWTASADDSATAGLKTGRYVPQEPAAPQREARQRAEEQDAERRAAEQAQAETAAQPAVWAAAQDETTVLPMPPVRFVANGENITYLEPNFVPYKMRPHVRALRMAIDLATIP